MGEKGAIGGSNGAIGEPHCSLQASKCCLKVPPFQMSGLLKKLRVQEMGQTEKLEKLPCSR